MKQRALILFLVVGSIAAAVAVLRSSDGFTLRRETAALLRKAQQVRERATVFEQHEVLASLEPSAHNGEYFRFDEQLAAAVPIAAQGDPAVSDSAPSASPLLAFELDGRDRIGLVPNQGNFRLVRSELRMEMVSKTQYLVNRSELELMPSEVAVIELRVRVEKGNEVELRWAQQPIPPDWTWDSDDSEEFRVGRLKVDVVPDGTYHTYRINAASALRHRTVPGQPIRSLLLRPSNKKGDRIAVDYLRFLSKQAVYGAQRYGRIHELIGEQSRAGLFLRSPARLRYSLRVPAAQPKMQFGIAMLKENPPVRFSVTVGAGGSEQTLVSRLGDGRHGWTDTTLDLGAFAGRDVEITLAAESDGTNVAFWSNPVLYGAPARRFNVIILLEDAMRADVSSVYGHPRATTPAKARLVAERGVVFERAFAQASTTRRSCPSLFTGLYPSATGVWNHQTMLDERYLTLAEILRSQGFETASFTQNVNSGRAAGLHQGFSFVFEGRSVSSHERIWEGPLLDFLDSHGERNFFVYLHTSDPHGPYDPPPPYDSRYRDQPRGTTPVTPDRRRYDPAWIEEPTAEGRRTLYEGEVRHNDERFASLIEELRRRRLLDSTLLILLSDHGEYFGEHDLHGHRAPTYVQGVHVPFILLHPSLPAGRRVTAPAQLIDVLPTILDFAGIDSTQLLLHGESLVHLWRDGDAGGDRIAVVEEPEAWKSRDQPESSGSLFVGDWHLLSSRFLPAAAIFDLGTDPHETQPDRGFAARLLLGRPAEAFLAELKSIDVSLWRAITGRTPSVVEFDPAAREQLRQLGYVE